MIFGYSMGGYVALKAAPSMSGLKGIMTLGTKFGWDDGFTAREIAMLEPEALQVSAPDFMDLQKARHRSRDLGGLFADTRQLMQRLGSGEDCLREEEIAAVECPVIICRGEKDRMVSEAESREMASRFQLGSYVEVPETLHDWEKVNIDLVRDLIMRSFGLE